jgi:hypothetical protein
VISGARDSGDELKVVHQVAHVQRDNHVANVGKDGHAARQCAQGELEKVGEQDSVEPELLGFEDARRRKSLKQIRFLRRDDTSLFGGEAIEVL